MAWNPFTKSVSSPFSRHPSADASSFPSLLHAQVDAALRFSVAFVLPDGRIEDCPPADAGDPDAGFAYDRVEERFDTLVSFLRSLGVSTATMRASDVDWAGKEAAAGARVYVFVLTTEDAALEWLNTSRHRVTPSRSALVMDFRLRSVEAADGSGAHLGDYMSIALGAKNGVAPAAPYEGLAHAVLDAIGSKIGPAFLSHHVAE